MPPRGAGEVMGLPGAGRGFGKLPGAREGAGEVTRSKGGGWGSYQEQRKEAGEVTGFRGAGERDGGGLDVTRGKGGG